MPKLDPLLQACPNCATLLDISEQEPFEQIHCPICGTSVRVRMQFNNFSLQETLGSGGMGAVYKALDQNLNRMVAFKVLRKEYSANEEYIAKFEMEAKITASINHPHVVKVFSFGDDHGLFYIAMELVDKGSLDDLMSLQGRVAEIQMLDVGIQIAEGLNAAYKKGLIHRDVKPGNILFANAKTAKIVDFGLAILMEQEAESRGEVWGTPYYVAPEKLNHEPEDFRSDIYSLGATLFHALSGRPPFEAETASMVALKHLKSQVVSLQAFAPDVSSATAYVVNRMLNKEPSERYQTYTELVEHLTYAKTQLLENISKPRQPKERMVVESEAQQNFMGWFIMSLIALIIISGVLVYVFRSTIFKLNDGAAPVAEQKSGPSTDFTPRYEDGRRQLLAGDYVNAGEAFRQLQEESSAEPLHTWIVLHQGLCALLNNHLSEAGEIFEKASKSSAPSEKVDPSLPRFFVETSQLAASPNPVEMTDVIGYDKNGVQSFALLIYAMKNWDLSEFEKAGALFQQFADATPQAPFVWIQDYKPIAQNFLTDFQGWKKVSEKLNKASTSEELADALHDLQVLKSALRTRGKLSEQIAKTEQGTQQKIDETNQAATQQQSRQTAAILEAETKAWNAAKNRFKAAVTTYNFGDAVKAIEPLVLQNTDLSQQKQTLLKKGKWLEQFKQTLMADINRVGYPQPVTKRGGAAIPGFAKIATDTEVRIQSAYGTVPVAWKELSPEMLLTMSNLFMRNATGKILAERQWCAGAFAMEMGLEKEGHAFLNAATQTNEEFRDQLPLF